MLPSPPRVEIWIIREYTTTKDSFINEKPNTNGDRAAARFEYEKDFKLNKNFQRSTSCLNPAIRQEVHASINRLTAVGVTAR